MKNKKIIIGLIILLSILSITLITFMMVLLNGGFKAMRFKFFNSVSNKLVVDEEYEQIFQQIEIIGDASQIEFHKSDTPYINIMIYGNEKNITVNNSNQKLFIQSKTKCNFFCFHTKLSRIVVYLPSDYNGKITIENNFGDIQVDEFLNANIDIEEDCGDVTVLGGKDVKISNNYGNITLEKADIADIKQSAGDIKIGEVSDITAENNFGDIKINQVMNYLQIKQDCGDVKIDSLTIHKDSSIENDLGDIKIGFTNDIYIQASTDLGKVKISNNSRESDVTLKLDNNCGDIIVKN